MSKLTKKQTYTLLGILRNLTGVQQFIKSPDTIIARRKRMATTTWTSPCPRVEPVLQSARTWALSRASVHGK